MTYQAPVADIAFCLRHVANLDGLQAEGIYPEATPDIVDAVLEEAGRFRPPTASPRSTARETVPVSGSNSRGVVTAPGWRQAYADWSAAGWNGLSGPTEFGGQGPATPAQCRLHGDVELCLHGPLASGRC